MKGHGEWGLEETALFVWANAVWAIPDVICRDLALARPEQ